MTRELREAAETWQRWTALMGTREPDPLAAALAGDPGLWAVQCRLARRQLTRKDVSTLPTLADYDVLEQKAVALAEQIVKAQDFLRDVTRRLRSGVTPIVGGKPYPAERLTRDAERIQGWVLELAALEHQMEDAWRHYLAAQPRGYRTLEKPSGRLMVLASRPLMGLPADAEVWYPAEICSALRVGRTLDPDLLRSLSPEEYLAHYCQLDPVAQALPEEKRPSLPRRQAKVAEAEAAGQMKAFDVATVEPKARRRKGKGHQPQQGRGTAALGVL